MRDEALAVSQGQVRLKLIGRNVPDLDFDGAVTVSVLEQNPLLVVVFLADALAAGTASLAILGSLGFSGGLDEATARGWLCASVGVLAALLVAELGITHQSKSADAAARMVLKGVYRRDFWGGVVLLGLLFPVGLALFGGSYVLAALLVLFGISIKSHLLIQAPQQVSLS